MGKTFKDLVILLLVNIFLVLLIWLPYTLKLPSFYGLNFSQGMEAIYQNYDGLEYVVIAKTFYQPGLVYQFAPQPPSYYPSHFPAYPTLIALFAPFIGFVKSMLFVSLLFTILSSVAFYFLLKDFKLTSQPLWLSILFLILPARWLVVHSVGSPEPMFIFFVITAFYFFKKYLDTNTWGFVWVSAILAALAQATRPPGILLFFAFLIYPAFLFIKKSWGHKINTSDILSAIKLKLRLSPYLLIPLTLLGVFYLFHINLGDFWGYFHSGDNIHLTFPPYQVFNANQFWVGSIWLEDIIYIFVLGFLAGVTLLKGSFAPAGIFVLTYLTASIFVAHRDISRYVLPIFPFALIAFEKVLVSKEFKIVMAIVFLAIYLYSQNFLLNNTAPIADWSAYNL